MQHEQALGPEPHLTDVDFALQHQLPDEPIAEEDVPIIRTRRAEWRPKQEEVEQHCITHLPYRGWCEDCVRGRGLARPHRSAAADAGEERSVSKVAMDWVHFKDSEGGSHAECASGSGQAHKF